MGWPRQVRRIRGGYNSRRHGGHGFDRRQLWPDGGALSLGWLGLRLCKPRDTSLSWLRGRMGHAPRLHADPCLLYSLRHAFPAKGTAYDALSHRCSRVCRRHHPIEPAWDSLHGTRQSGAVGPYGDCSAEFHRAGDSLHRYSPGHFGSCFLSSRSIGPGPFMSAPSPRPHPSRP